MPREDPFHETLPGGDCCCGQENTLETAKVNPPQGPKRTGLAGCHCRRVWKQMVEDSGGPQPSKINAAAEGNCASSLCLSSPMAGEHLPGFCMLEPTLACWANVCTEQLALDNKLQHQLNPPNITWGPQNLTCKAWRPQNPS